MYPTKEETALWMALNRAQDSVYSAMDAVLKGEGLPRLRWYDVLWSIERAGGPGLRPFELEKALIFEQSNLSRLLRRMIEEGLVEESVLETDRRGRLLRITKKGRQVRKQMWTVYGPMIHAHMSKLSENHDLVKIAAALTALLQEQE